MCSSDLVARDLLRFADIRSDQAGSRPRTAFIRVAGTFFREKTGQWHDDWVANLATLAFPFGEPITIDMVKSARRVLTKPKRKSITKEM